MLRGGSTSTVQYTVEGIESAECPRSYITGESAKLVTEIKQANWVKTTSGAWPGGTDSDNWDVRFVDAVGMFAIEDNRIESAERKAVR